MSHVKLCPATFCLCDDITRTQVSVFGPFSFTFVILDFSSCVTSTLNKITWLCFRFASEEEIDRLIKQNAMQEKLATYTVNFVATLAINQQQQVAAEAINFMTTFASTYYSDIRQGNALQEISATHDEIVYLK